MNLQPSRYLAWGLLVCLAMAVMAIGLSALPIICKAIVLFLIVLYTSRYYRQFISLSHIHSIHTLRLIDDRWRIKTSGGWFQAWPEGDVVATSFLICCRFRLEGQRHPVFLILLPDSADVRELHGLRLKLMLDASACLNPDS